MGKSKEVRPTIAESNINYVERQKGKGFVIIGVPDIYQKEQKNKKKKGRLPHQYPWVG